MTNRVGFIGLGAIGEPMARHIAAAFETCVWNRTTARAESFATETGAMLAASPREVVAGVDAVITCLPTSKEVLEIVDAVGDGWREGQLLVDSTSGDPAGSREAAARLREHGVGFVDAPVSGGTSGATAGTLTVMLGGDEPWVSRAKELVAPYAGKVEHVGSVGAAHAVKAVNQALLAVNIQAVAEGLAALVKLGVKADVALDVINASTGRSNVTENLFPRRVVTREWPRTFRLALLDKDVGIALKMLEDLDVPHETFRTARRFCAEARQVLGEEADHVEAVKEIEQAAGVQIK
jgi:3-hydroxyisobutyrate dehydrogenase